MLSLDSNFLIVIIFKIYIMMVYYHNYKLYKNILRTKNIYSSY